MKLSLTRYETFAREFSMSRVTASALFLFVLSGWAAENEKENLRRDTKQSVKQSPTSARGFVATGDTAIDSRATEALQSVFEISLPSSLVAVEGLQLNGFATIAELGTIWTLLLHEEEYGGLDERPTMTNSPSHSVFHPMAGWPAWR